MKNFLQFFASKNAQKNQPQKYAYYRIPEPKENDGLIAFIVLLFMLSVIIGGALCLIISHDKF